MLTIKNHIYSFARDDLLPQRKSALIEIKADSYMMLLLTKYIKLSSNRENTLMEHRIGGTKIFLGTLVFIESTCMQCETEKHVDSKIYEGNFTIVV